MNIRLIVEILPEIIGDDIKITSIRSKLIYKDKTYEKKEVLNEDILLSHFDRIFDYAKYEIKECLKSEVNTPKEK